MAEIVRRRSWGGVLPLGRHVSISGSSLIQCASASMAPPHPGGVKCYPSAEVQGRTGPSSLDRVDRLADKLQVAHNLAGHRCGLCINTIFQETILCGNEFGDLGTKY